MSGRLVLITGTGRSGTSTIAGTLHHLGLSVPGPLLGANESNPRGFFESSWAVRFHKRLAARAVIDPFDSRPSAFDRVQRAVTPEMRAQLTEFLAGHAADSDQVVVKDPRSVWTQRLWKDAAAEVGLDIVYLSMLRHPAEVVGSRTTYYARGGEDDIRRYATFNVCRWVNSSLISERETRDETRVLVHYTDLLADWRSTMARVRDDLGLTLNDDLDPAHAHPVDEFIDPDLRRHRVGWDELEIPTHLEELAQSVWDDLGVLGKAPRSTDAAVSQRLDTLAGDYSRLVFEATAISHDTLEEARHRARAAGMRAAKPGKPGKPGKDGKRAEAPAGGEARRVEDVGARELLSVVGRRVASRLRRH